MSRPIAAIAGAAECRESRPLFNALAGENISIVKDTPGVTQRPDLRRRRVAECQFYPDRYRWN